MKRILSVVLCAVLLFSLCSCGGRANSAKDFKYKLDKNNVIIEEYIGDSKDVIIPKEIEGKPVTTIGSCAFMGKEIESVKFPDSVTLIWNYAFADCEHLKEVEFSENIEQIMENAFIKCVSLKEVKLPEKLELLGTSAFKECGSLEKVHINKNLNRMGMEVFYACPITDITFEDGIKKIGSYAAFWSSSEIDNVVIPASVERIVGYSFNNKLNKVTFKGDAPKEYEKSAFGGRAEIHYKKSAEGWDETPLRNEYVLKAK